jgi:ATP-dependent Lon protease
MGTTEPDLDDVPADVLDAVTVHLVAEVGEILGGALEPVRADAATAA